MHFEQPIKTLIMDQAKEHLGKRIRTWAVEQNIRQHFTTPHHHQSNGKVERFNRAIQEGINKIKNQGTMETRVKKVVEVYNNVRHTGIGMSPKDAKNPKNWSEIRRKQI